MHLSYDPQFVRLSVSKRFLHEASPSFFRAFPMCFGFVTPKTRTSCLICEKCCQNPWSLAIIAAVRNAQCIIAPQWNTFAQSSLLSVLTPNLEEINLYCNEPNLLRSNDIVSSSFIKTYRAVVPQPGVRTAPQVLTQADLHDLREELKFPTKVKNAIFTDFFVRTRCEVYNDRQHHFYHWRLNLKYHLLIQFPVRVTKAYRSRSKFRAPDMRIKMMQAEIVVNLRTNMLKAVSIADIKPGQSILAETPGITTDNALSDPNPKRHSFLTKEPHWFLPCRHQGGSLDPQSLFFSDIHPGS